MVVASMEILPGRDTAQSAGGNIKKPKPHRKARPTGLAGKESVMGTKELILQYFTSPQSIASLFVFVLDEIKSNFDLPNKLSNYSWYTILKFINQFSFTIQYL